MNANNPQTWSACEHWARVLSIQSIQLVGGLLANCLVFTAATAGEPPSIWQQPINHTKYTGQSAVFCMAATGTPPLGFQWQFNGAPITAATLATLSLNQLTPTHAGNYSVVVSNSSGCVTSWPAALTVLPGSPAPGSLDLTFEVSGGGQFGTFDGTHPIGVNAAVVQPDEKILMGDKLARLNADGTLATAVSSRPRRARPI